jgi:signal transduction histidine kinase
LTLHETQLVAYTAGAVIHGTLAVLVLKLYRHTTGPDRVEAFERVAVCLAGFFWQFGNLWDKSRMFYPLLGNLLWYGALVSFPFLLANSLNEPAHDSRVAGALTKSGRALRYPLAIFALLSIVSAFLAAFGGAPLINLDFAAQLTMNMLLFYIVLFVILGAIKKRRLRFTGDHPSKNANRLVLVLMPITAVMCIVILYYPGAVRANARWLELAAGMMSIPSTIGTAYRLYRFPFMDIFVRETLTGIVLLTLFCIGLSTGPQNHWWPLWIASLAMGIAVARTPISRWIEQTFLGYDESAEQQEERVGAAIRNLRDLGQFDDRASGILRTEMEADWVKISSEPAAGAAATVPIPDSPPLTLSFGPRRHGRPYMSRQLQVARTSALQIAAQHQRLKREDSERQSLIEKHQLRETTARAQMRALQAQINPHFLFNTLNTLAALIDSNPEKAEHITENLADVFRYALDSTLKDRVKLDDEVKFLESYLAIEKARFDTRLSYSFDVDPAARTLSIPPMILQPLVENAVRHGIGQKIEGGEVRVSARMDAERLTLRVEDTGVGFAGERAGGVGLTNTRDRLRHAYGDSAEFRIEVLEPEGTTMVITLTP